MAITLLVAVIFLAVVLLLVLLAGRGVEPTAVRWSGDRAVAAEQPIAAIGEALPRRDTPDWIVLL